MDRRTDHASAAAIPWRDDRRAASRDAKRQLASVAAQILTSHVSGPTPEVHATELQRYAARDRRQQCVPVSTERRSGSDRRR